MKRAWLIGGAWVVATIATASIALAVVGLAGDQVTAEAVFPLSAREIEELGAAATVGPAGAGSGVAGSGAATSAPITGGSAPSGTLEASAGSSTTLDVQSPAATITDGSSAETAVPGTSAPTTSAVSPAAPVVTTTTEPAGAISGGSGGDDEEDGGDGGGDSGDEGGDSGDDVNIDSYRVTGGTVVVRWTSSWVELVSASPSQGFSVEVDSSGRDKVVVSFESGETETKFTARISDGSISVKTESD